MHYSRAEWVLQGASDIGRIDVNFGGVTACKKAVDVYEAFGIPCECTVVGSLTPPYWVQRLRRLASSTSAVCYVRASTTTRHRHNLNSPCDPMDEEGNVLLPQGHGLGMDFNWDYIDDNRVA